MNLILNFSMAFLWASATGNFSLDNFLFGFAISFFVLLFLGRETGLLQSTKRLRAAVSLFAFFIWELVLANLRVAYEILTPSLTVRPAIVAIPLDLRSDTQITLLAILLTLTPGSVSLDVSKDRRFLFVHTMYIDDVEAFREKIKRVFERRILEVFS